MWVTSSGGAAATDVGVKVNESRDATTYVVNILLTVSLPLAAISVDSPSTV
jgi:hypothetical protein